MLKQQIHQIVQENPDYAAITPVIEKEILHYQPWYKKTASQISHPPCARKDNILSLRGV